MTATAATSFSPTAAQCIITMFSLAFQVHLPLSRTACHGNTRRGAQVSIGIGSPTHLTHNPLAHPLARASTQADLLLI